VTFARHHRTNKANPLEPDPAGRWRIDGSVYLPAEEDTPAEERWTSHFATCPNRERHRRTTTTGGTA